MDPLGCILKFMRYVRLHHFESILIKLLLSREPVHLAKSFKDWAVIFTGTLVLPVHSVGVYSQHRKIVLFFSSLPWAF